MNYWPRWINAITNKTAHLSLAQMGAYDRLLDHYYKAEAPLPGDLTSCCRIVRATTKADQEAVRSVLAEFFQLEANGYSQARVSAEIAISQPKIAAAQANGVRGGRPKGTRKKPSGLLKPNPAATQDEPRPKAPHPQSISSLRSEIPPTPVGGAGRFEQFWLAYPSKVGKDAARKAFEKRSPDAELLDAMLSALAAQTASSRWQKDGGQYIPNPSTWLNQGRWLDEANTIEVTDGGRREVEATRDYLARQAEHAARAKGPTPEVLAKLRGVVRVAT